MLINVFSIVSLINLLIIRAAHGQTTTSSLTTLPLPTSDLEDPLRCPFYSWNQGWIAVATNAFQSSTTCCSGRVLGWKLYDDRMKELKGNPDAPPYCFYTRRLGSELVMKTLVAEKCGLFYGVTCGENSKFRCNHRTHTCNHRRAAGGIKKKVI